MKTVLITGASRGIGKACAEAFAQAGYSVLINYKSSEQKARELAIKLRNNGTDADIFGCDVSDPAEVSRMHDFCRERFGKISVLVNNAGTSLHGLFTDMTDTQWQDVRKTLDGAVFCSREFIPDMLNRGGSIVNVSSIWGTVGGSCESGYSAAKAGITGLTKALSKELAPSGITVNCVSPGCIDTDMCAHLDKDELAQNTPLHRLGTPEEVAQAVLFLAENRFITGQNLGVDGGFN